MQFRGFKKSVQMASAVSFAALALVGAPCAHAQTESSAQSVAGTGQIDRAYYEKLISAINQVSTQGFMTGTIKSYVNNFVSSYYEDNPTIEQDWNQPKIDAEIALFVAPVVEPTTERIYAKMAANLPMDRSQQVMGLIDQPSARKTLECAMLKPPPQRTAAVWAQCGKTSGRVFTAAEQALSNSAQEAVTDALVQPYVNGALGGTACHVIERFADHLSKGDTKYTFDITFALTGSEPAKGCNVNKLRWSALAGLDAQLALEPQMVFAKKED